MMIKLIMSTMILSITFMVMSHPLSMTLMLIVMSTIIAMITGMLNLNYWYSYILFMVMVGGMLVIFIYMTSIASNEKFSIKPLMVTMLMPLMAINMEETTMNHMFSDSMKMYKLVNNTLSMNKYISVPSTMIMILMIIYLLVTLIAIVKITNIKYGPLRQNT